VKIILFFIWKLTDKIIRKFFLLALVKDSLRFHKFMLVHLFVEFINGPGKKNLFKILHSAIIA